MERDFGQLIFVALFILAGLFDLFVRWRKGRARRDAPPQADEELPFVEEDETDLEELARIEPRPPLAAPERDAPPAQAPEPPRPPPRPPQPRDRPHRRRGRHWPMDRTDARRGIVLMSVLGPLVASRLHPVTRTWSRPGLRGEPAHSPPSVDMRTTRTANEQAESLTQVEHAHVRSR